MALTVPARSLSVSVMVCFCQSIRRCLSFVGVLSVCVFIGQF